MPGIFGAVHLDLSELPQDAEANLAAMRTCLSHSPEYATRHCPFNSSGIHVELIGHEAAFNHPSDLNNDTETCFAYGRLTHSSQTAFSPVDLEGYFSVAHYDSSDRRFRLVVDKRSAQPIYYRRVNDVLYFAPEAKALAALQGVQNKPNYSAMAALLGQGHLYNHQSLFADIHRLPGGTELVFQNSEYSVSTYWEFFPGTEPDGSSKSDLLDELRALLDASVKEVFDEPASSVVFLSGGYDSRAILGSALAVASEPVNTVSWGLDETEPGTDSQIARDMAKATKCRHSFLQRSVEDFADWFEESVYLIDSQSDVPAYHPQEYELMKRLHDMGFSNLLRGDEAFGWRYRAYSHASAFGNVIVRPFEHIHGWSDFVDPSAHRQMSAANNEDFSNVWQACGKLSPNIAKDHLYFTQRLQTYLASASYYKQVLHQQANPLLSDAILNFMRKVPDRLRVDKALFSEMVHTRYGDLGRYPIADKSGLEDWDALLARSGPVRQYMIDQVNDNASPVWSIFQQRKFQELVERLQAKTAVSAAPTGHTGLEALGRQALERVAPPVFDYLRGKKAMSLGPSDTAVLMRFIVLKNWCDRYF